MPTQQETQTHTFLDKSTDVRDVSENGSRFWIVDSLDPSDTGSDAFGSQTVGIADENESGIVAYCHEANAPRLIEALRAFTGEV